MSKIVDEAKSQKELYSQSSVLETYYGCELTFYNHAHHTVYACAYVCIGMPV